MTWTYLYDFRPMVMISENLAREFWGTSSAAWLFVRYGLALAGTGAVIGLAAAAVLTRLMESVLFGISPVAPLTYTAMPIILVAATVLASYLSARRAAVVDPVDTLRAA